MNQTYISMSGKLLYTESLVSKKKCVYLGSKAQWTTAYYVYCRAREV